MKITWSLLLILFSLNSFGQKAYEQKMTEALKEWKTGKNLEAMRLFEKIATDEPQNWIPKYYLVLSGTRASFHMKDAQKKIALIDSLTTLLPKEPQEQNAEWHILSALLLTSELISDPMANGMNLTPQIVFYYSRALALEPNNPRALAGLAEFNLNYKRYMGGDTQEECNQLKKAILFFDEVNNKTLFYPSWGKERALELLATCK
ncbi:hypothetical protein ACFRAE_04960 [Sphingobacterium sp. HJSM2_6]|uniref:hypothetical protein n=1 Tax=Sphingobacterium sp. HJSM2_6 TaxID=3366264 RepID=UPI003BCC30EF